MITRLAVYGTLGILVSYLGWSLSDWEFWAILGLFWSAETLSRFEEQSNKIEELETLRKWSATAVVQLQQNGDTLVEAANCIEKLEARVRELESKQNG